MALGQIKLVLGLVFVLVVHLGDAAASKSVSIQDSNKNRDNISDHPTSRQRACLIPCIVEFQPCIAGCGCCDGGTCDTVDFAAGTGALLPDERWVCVIGGED